MPVVKVIRACEGVGPQVSPSLLPVVKKVKNKIKTNAVPTPENIPDPAKPVKKLKKSTVPVSDPVPDSENGGAGGGRVTCKTFLTSKKHEEEIKKYEEQCNAIKIKRKITVAPFDYKKYARTMKNMDQKEMINGRLMDWGLNTVPLLRFRDCESDSEAVRKIIEAARLFVEAVRVLVEAVRVTKEAVRML
jgi:hypothetical protein